jgi:hypothetical protein
MLVLYADQFIEQTRKLNVPTKRNESMNAQLLETNYYFIINLYIFLNHISACIRYYVFCVVNVCTLILLRAIT